MTNILSVNTVRFVVLLLLQVLIFSNINFLGYINPHVYILFILLFPVKNNRMTIIFLSFLIGLSIDMFLDTGGINAGASVLIAYIRPAALKFSFGTLYDHQSINFNTTELGQNITYISILTVIHHFTYFTLETFNFSKILLILQNTLYSSIFTILLCVLITIIFSRKKKK